MTGPLVTGLYVPGDRPDRFDKAVATGADLVILDLEDAVAPSAKDDARRSVVAWLTERAQTGAAEDAPVIQVRVNAGSREDLEALVAVNAHFELRVPKVEHPSDIDEVVSVCGGRPVTALIETARGVENAAVIAAHPAVTRIALGESDLASELGTQSTAVLDYARIRLLYAARAAGIEAPMLSAYTRIQDLEGLRADTERGRDIGWFGRTAVHPKQLPVIRAVFAPESADVEWAQQVLTAMTDGGVATLPSGEMVDAAMVGRARAILDRARS